MQPIDKLIENPNQCPYCASDNIENGPTETTDTANLECTIVVTCHDCSTQWVEVYKLAEVVQIQNQGE